MKGKGGNQMVVSKCPQIDLSIDNEEKYLEEIKAYEKRMARYRKFNGLIFVFYMFYFLLVYYVAVPSMNELKDSSEWYNAFMDFIFVPAPHVCISIYLYGMALFVLTVLLVYLRFKVVVPDRYSLPYVAKNALKCFASSVIIPMIIAIFAFFALGAIGKFIYMGVVWICSLSCYICSYAILTTRLEVLTDKPKIPFGVTEADKKIIEARDFRRMPPAVAAEVKRQDMEWNNKIKTDAQNIRLKQRIEKDREDREKDRKEVFSQAMTELNSLIGMDELKSEVKKFVADIEMQKKKEQYGIKTGNKAALHMIFEGPPGTGKTTVARIMGKILYGVGYLPGSGIVEVDRSDLIGEYVGQTAPKIKKVFEVAEGGVLFIDEAYSLTPSRTGGGFENEAIDTIVKLMEDKRGDVVVIFAGYPDQMREFVRANPGLQSRIPYTFTFTPYTAEDLYAIFMAMVKPTEYKVADEDVSFVKKCIFELAPYLKDANARDIRTFHEKMCKEQNYRLSKEDAEKQKNVTRKTLTEKETAEIREDMVTFRRYEIEIAYKFIMESKLRGQRQAVN